MSYVLHRGDTEDFELGQALFSTDVQGGPTGNPSATVSVPPNATHFFKVVASDSRGNSLESVNVVSAHTPALYTSGEIDYAAHVAELAWNIQESGGGTNTCLTCHDGSNFPTNRLDLSSYDGLMNGVGDVNNPDSFIVAGDGDATWGLFTFRFMDPLNEMHHLPFTGSAFLLEAVLKPWADEGALELPDSSAPRFDKSPGNSTAYTATPNWEAETVDIQFYHALDPESVRYGSSPTLDDQLEYRIYGGVDKNSIDWLVPLATLVFPGGADGIEGNADDIFFPFTDFSYTTVISWTESAGTFIVRAVDFVGNETCHDAELTIQR